MKTRFQRLQFPSFELSRFQMGILKVLSQADYLLFDAPVAGSGQTFDWDFAERSENPAGLLSSLVA